MTLTTLAAASRRALSEQAAEGFAGAIAQALRALPIELGPDLIE